MLESKDVLFYLVRKKMFIFCGLSFFICCGSFVFIFIFWYDIFYNVMVNELGSVYLGMYLIVIVDWFSENM